MNNNKKLGLSISLTAIAAFSAGFVTAADHQDAPLIRALEAVGQNLFGDNNFGVSVVAGNPPDDNIPATVQIDLAGGGPPDDNHPVLFNVFVPPDPVSPAPACVATAQIAVTSEGVRVIINPEVMGPTGGPIMAEYAAPLGVPPDPCRDNNVIGPGPG